MWEAYHIVIKTFLFFQWSISETSPSILQPETLNYLFPCISNIIFLTIDGASMDFVWVASKYCTIDKLIECQSFDNFVQSVLTCE